MKKYQELKIEILVLTEQDVVTASGFLTYQQHSFGAPQFTTTQEQWDE